MLSFIHTSEDTRGSIANKGDWEAAQEQGHIDILWLLWINSSRAKQANTERNGGQRNKHSNWGDLTGLAKQREGGILQTQTLQMTHL